MKMFSSVKFSRLMVLAVITFTGFFSTTASAQAEKSPVITLVSAENFPDGKLNKEAIEKVLTGGTLLGVGGSTGDARVNYRYQLTFQKEGVVLSGDKGIVGKWWVVRDIFYITIPGWKNSISVATVFVSGGRIEFRDPVSNELWLSQY